MQECEACLVVRIAEVLYLCLGELPYTQQPLPGRYLIPVGLPDLGGSKWQLVAIVVIQVPGGRHKPSISAFPADAQP